MKKRAWMILAVVTALMVVLTACGSSAASDSSSMNSAPEAPKVEEQYSSDNGFAGPMMDSNAMPEEEATTAGNPVTVGRKLVKTVWVELESKHYDETLAQLQKLVEQAGGYIESQSEQGQSYYNTSSYRSRYASITARIPAEKLDEVTGAAGELCNLVSKSTDTTDITDSYIDTEARLKSLTLQEERLLAILAKATTLSDVIELEQSLADVRYQIESLTAQIRNMDGQVSYSTLNLTLSEVVEYNLVSNPPETLGQRLADAWQNAITLVQNGFANFMVWLVTYLPSILIWVVVLGAVAYVVIRILRRRKAARKTALPAETAPAEKQEEKPKE